ncbi:MAG: nuclear transport factor 2 family protein [Proteobacteria bacterium]|nr:nuclear transport factor 2 family protein [Pseudomonadota bacterium]
MLTPTEVVQAMYAAYGSGNMEALKNTLSDDIQWIYHGTDEIEHSGVYKGKEGVTDFFNNVNAHIDYLDFKPNQFIADGNMVVVLGNERQKIKKNSEMLEQEWVQVYTVENQLITRMEEFSNTSRAAKLHTK